MTATTVLQFCYIIFYRGMFSYFISHVISLRQGGDLCLQDWQTLRDLKETRTVRKERPKQKNNGKKSPPTTKNPHPTKEANTKPAKTFHFDIFFWSLVLPCPSKPYCTSLKWVPRMAVFSLPCML